MCAFVCVCAHVCVAKADKTSLDVCPLHVTIPRGKASPSGGYQAEQRLLCSVIPLCCLQLHLPVPLFCVQWPTAVTLYYKIHTTHDTYIQHTYYFRLFFALFMELNNVDDYYLF